MSVNDYGLDPGQLGRQEFRDLTAEDWATILKKAQLMSFDRDQVVLKQGEKSPGLYIVRSGWLRVERNSHGQTFLLARRGPGELLGEMSMLEQTRAMASVIADEAVELYLLSSTDLTDLLYEAPGFATRYYRSLALHLSGRLREAALRFEQAVDARQESRYAAGELSSEVYPLYISYRCF